MRLALAVCAALLFAPPAGATDYCRPKADGTHRMVKADGRACPSGYFASGRCCEAFRRDQPQAFPRVEGRACPSGTHASGGACLPFR